MTCNGVHYIVKVQPDKKRKMVALQALGAYPDSEPPHGKGYYLLEDNSVLAALLEMILYQAIEQPTPVDKSDA